MNLPFPEFSDSLNDLIDYYDDTWIENSLGHAFFSAFDVTKHRTTNHAESYHGRLHRHYPNTHPKLGEWLILNQELQNAEEMEGLAVSQGNQEPNEGVALYNELNEQINAKKTELDGFLFDVHTADEERAYLDSWLGNMGYLMGLHPTEEELDYEPSGLESEYTSESNEDEESNLE